MPKPDIKRLIEFHVLLLDFQAIERGIHVPKSLRKENDVEHSYNLALCAWFLSEYFPELDRDKIIRFALVHDLVEVYAGDTYAYDDEAVVAGKKEREHKALIKFDENWSDFPDMISNIKEYETKHSSEAKFVYALDKIMPAIVILLSDGYTWKKENIALERIHNLKGPQIAISPEIKPYYDQLYKLLKQHAHYFPKSKAGK